MKHRIASALVGFVFASLFAGCVIRSGPGTTSEIPANAQGQTSGPAIVIINRSSQSICIVKFSPSSDSQWGPDRLGSSEQISAGASRGWSVTSGEWDVRLEDCRGNMLAESRNVAVGNAPAGLVYE